MSAGAAGALPLHSVPAGNAGGVTRFSWITLASIFRCDFSAAVAVALICCAGRDPAAAETAAGRALVALKGFESGAVARLVAGGL